MRKVRSRLRLRPGKGIRNEGLLQRSLLWVFCCFLPSQHPLSSTGNRIHLSHFPTFTPYCSGVLTSPLAQWMGQAEHDFKVEAGAVNWLHEPNRSDFYHWGRESLFPLGLLLKQLRNIRGRDAYLERKNKNPKDWVAPLGPAVPTHSLYCYQSQQSLWQRPALIELFCSKKF